MYVFAIRYIETGTAGTRYFSAKEKYSVSISVSGFRSCTCMRGSFAASRNETAECKHAMKAKELLEVMEDGQKRLDKNKKIRGLNNGQNPNESVQRS